MDPVGGSKILGAVRRPLGLLGMWIGLPAVLAADPDSNEVLRSGAGSVLQELRFTLDPTQTGCPPEWVTLGLGFATDEQGSAGALVDSLSLSLVGGGSMQEALVLVIDAFGLHAAPEDPDGIAFSSEFLLAQAVLFPALEAPQGMRIAYDLRVDVPPEMRTGSLTLSLRLFDNGNGLASAGYFMEQRGYPVGGAFAVQSSTSPGGPFADEMGVGREESPGRFKVPGRLVRFFRIRSNSTVSLRLLAYSPEGVRLAYEFPAPNPILESAPAPAGPYGAVADATLEDGGRSFRVTAGSGNRFFRIRATVEVQMLTPFAAGAELRLPFQFRPRIFVLQSSAQPCGPYADDPAGLFLFDRQEISVRRDREVRFFRTRGLLDGGQVSLTAPSVEGENWLVPYVILR